MEYPIIDREIFFGNPEISSGTLSPDGSKIAFLKAYHGILNIYVKAAEAPFEDALPLTDSISPIMGFFWTYDSKYILYVNDNHGDENFNIFRVSPETAEGVIPPSVNLTPFDEITAQIYQVSKLNPDKLMVGINHRDKAWHDLYELTVSTAQAILIHENNDRLQGWEFDWDEKARLAYRTDENGFNQILRVDDDGSFTQIYETNLQESAAVEGWNEDSSAFYLASNKGDVDLTTLFLMDPLTAQKQKIESDPEGLVDFGHIFIDRNSRKILSTSYTLHKTKKYWRDADWEADYNFLLSRFPGKEIGFTSSTSHYEKLLFAVSGDNIASEVYLFDRITKDIIFQYTPQPRLKEIEQYLSAMHPISFESSDGLVIPAYLSLPPRKEGEKLPMVVVVHGGPKGPRDYWGYNGNAQFMTNRGYAVLQINFRASGGYGKAFLNAGDKEWGRKMQDDITWGVKHIIDLGIADPNRVCIFGGSYGGYATLAGMAFTPKLYVCGIDIVGPSNLFTLLETIPPYWEAGRKWLYEMVGDPETEEGRALLKERSPLFFVDQFERPLMIVQGANDPRVKQAESDQIALALHHKGKDVVYLNAQDEGHGFRKPVNRMAMYAAVEAFLAHHLGGRYQEDMPEPVETRLKEITVDIAQLATSVTFES